MTSTQKHHVSRVLEDIAREVGSIRETVDSIFEEIRDSDSYRGYNNHYGWPSDDGQE